MVTLTMVVALAGCSSGGGGGSESRRDDPGRSAERTSTTVAPIGIDLSEPIPGGSLHGTPRPPLENTGDDYVAIFASLTANFRWLTENPDVAVISELFVPGTVNHDSRVEAYGYLVANGYRWADEGYQLLSVDIVDARAGAVSLEVVQQLEFERIVDAGGQQVGDVKPHGMPETLNFLLATDEAGHWRIADITRAADETVEL
ncbi:MAG: hypothetical protein ACT4PI_12530 [Actinomycetota bacterium]